MTDLRQVTPLLARKGKLHGGLGHTVLAGEASTAFACGVSTPSTQNAIVCELRSGILLAGVGRTAAVSALAHLVLGVVVVCANPQVFRVHACGVVSTRAVVADEHAVRNSPVLDCPSDAVCRRGHMSSWQLDCAVATHVDVGCPDPARLCFADLGPVTREKTRLYASIGEQVVFVNHAAIVDGPRS